MERRFKRQTVEYRWLRCFPPELSPSPPTHAPPLPPGNRVTRRRLPRSDWDTPRPLGPSMLGPQCPVSYSSCPQSWKASCPMNVASHMIPDQHRYGLHAARCVYTRKTDHVTCTWDWRSDCFAVCCLSILCFSRLLNVSWMKTLTGHTEWPHNECIQLIDLSPPLFSVFPQNWRKVCESWL